MNINLQIERANLLNKLHRKGNSWVLYNIWNAGSAEVLQAAGAKVIATGSWSVATSHGYEDGEELPALSFNCRCIVCLNASHKYAILWLDRFASMSGTSLSVVNMLI